MITIRNDTEENDDWIKQTPGGRREHAVHFLVNMELAQEEQEQGNAELPLEDNKPKAD